MQRNGKQFVCEISTSRKSIGLWNNLKKTDTVRINITQRRVRVTIIAVEME